MQALGYFCSYVPEELVIACGLSAVRFVPDFSSPVSPLFPIPFCTLCKSFTQWALSQKDLLGCIVPLSCDASRRTYETLQALSLPVFPLDVPAFPSPEAVRYFAENLKALSLKLTDISGIPFTTFEKNLKNILQKSHCNTKQEERKDRPSLLLLGSHYASTILPLLEARGFTVFADLPEKRPYLFLDSPSSPPFPLDGLAQRVLLERLPCPRFPGKGRRQFLKKLCTELSIKGVIIFFSKFCDPQLYEIGLLRKELSIPTLLLEHDCTASFAQWETRLEAFLEMISHG
ncbi:MAG: 2-hydroxyacyl-CoA dehydratase family protein [Atribacterota bacterium]